MKEAIKGAASGWSEQEYRRRWLQQLQLEFRQICSWFRVPLRMPAFRISNSTKNLGSWEPGTRTISISSALVNGFSWDAVISVLKHEMAHQYVHEHMDRGMERPHGGAFGEACEILGVPPPFDRAAGDTPKVFIESTGGDGDPQYSRKIEKVRKMLSLAGSSNRHEAAAAMSKANSFICRYNLERLESSEPSRYCYEIVNTGRKRLPAIERRIAGLLMDYFFVDIVYAELFDPARADSFKTIELIGSRENVAIARHVYGFLYRQVECLWKNHRKKTGKQRKYRKTYILGLLQGFREKLEKEERKQGPPAGGDGRQTISALVVARDPGLAEFCRRRFPRLRTVRYRASAIRCSVTYAAGRKEGRKITIHQGICHEEGNRGRVLGR